MGDTAGKTGGTTRRWFLGQVGGVTLSGGLLWGWLLQSSQARASTTLRPPGARPEADYVAACIKCGMCVKACPFDILRGADVGDDGAPGVPYFTARKAPCRMCPEVPCAKACPTGALDGDLHIEQARMGVAVLMDQNACIAFQGLRCEVCYRVCPLMGKAISLRYRHQERTGAHAFFEPVVNAEACTGCGMCEHACILEESAIRVFPRSLALGRRGSNYRLGWKEPAEISRNFGKDTPAPGPDVKAWQEKTTGEALKSLEDTGKLFD